MRVDPSEFQDVTGRILSAAIEVHRTLGPGLLESIYTPCLQVELTARQLRFVAQRPVPISYKGIPLEAGYRIDLMDGVKRLLNPRASVDRQSVQ